MTDIHHWTATQSYAVNIPSAVGANTAWFGFTGGTTGVPANSFQDILWWTYGQPQMSVTPVSPDPATGPVNAVAVNATRPVQGLDPGDLSLTGDAAAVALGSTPAVATANGGQTYSVSNLAGFTGVQGAYVLTVAAAGVSDAGGNTPAASASDAWSLNPSQTSYDWTGGAGVWTAGVGGTFPWDLGGNWQGGVAPDAVGDTAVLGAAVSNGTATITLDAARTVSSLTFSPGTGGSYDLSGSGASSLQLANSGSSASISVASGASAIDAPVVLGDNLNVTAAGGTGLTITGPISEIGGSRSLTLSGGGSLILSGTNTYTGSTIVSAGTLLINSANALAGGGSLTIGAGGTFIFDPSVAGSGATSSQVLLVPIAADVSASGGVAAPALASASHWAGHALVQNESPSPPAPLPKGEGSDLPSPPAPLPKGEGSSRKLAWLGQAAISSDGSDNLDLRHKKAAAILALEAVFAQYGR